MINQFYRDYSIKQVTVVGIPRFAIYSITGAAMTNRPFFSVEAAKKYIDEVINGYR